MKKTLAVPVVAVLCLLAFAAAMLFASSATRPIATMVAMKHLDVQPAGTPAQAIALPTAMTADVALATVTVVSPAKQVKVVAASQEVTASAGTSQTLAKGQHGGKFSFGFALMDSQKNATVMLAAKTMKTAATTATG